MIRHGASWNDLTVLPTGEVAWVYLRGTTVVCESAETGAVKWSVDAKRQLLYLRCAASHNGSVCAIGVGQDDNAAFVIDGRLPVMCGPAAGPSAVEIEGHTDGGWTAYVMRSATSYDVLDIAPDGRWTTLRSVRTPQTSQGILEARNGQIVMSDAGRFAHGLVLPNVVDKVWAGQLPDPNGLALYDETTGKVSTLFLGNSQPPHIAKASGTFYVCAFREVERQSVAWLERYTRPFQLDVPDPVVPPPDPKPTVMGLTIVTPRKDQFPFTTGQDGTVRCVVAADPPGAALPRVLRWVYRREGTGAWQQWKEPRNPADDNDNTYQFAPGRWEIAANWEGGGQTSFKRLVIVPGPVAPPDPTKPPDPPSPPADNRVVLKTLNGAYVRMGPDGVLDASALDVKSASAFVLSTVGNLSSVEEVKSGLVVRAEFGGGWRLIVDRVQVGSEETYRREEVDGGFALCSSNGFYWSAEHAGGGYLRADQRIASSWETFTTGPAPSVTINKGLGGAVRIDPRGGFMVNGAPALIVSCHNGGGFSRSTYDWDGEMAVLNLITEAGYDISREWTTLGGDFWYSHGARAGWPNDGRDRRCGPRFTPDFRNRLVAYWQAKIARGVGSHTALGGMDAETVPDRGQLADILRDAIATVGPDHIAVAEVLNECRDTGEQDPNKLAEFARRAYGGFPGLLIGLSAYTGADFEATEVSPQRLKDFSRSPANVVMYHGYRGGGWQNKLERDWNLSYDWHLDKPIVDGEPVGTQPRTSATDNMGELNTGFFQLRAAMMLATGRICTLMSGAGVISNEGLGTLDQAVGFWETPKVKDWLPAHAGHFRDVFHGGDDRSFSPRRLFKAIGDTRVEHMLNPDTGEFITVASGPDAHHLPTNRAFTILNDTHVDDGHVQGRVTYGQA